MNQTTILITSITMGFFSWAIIAYFWLIPWLKDNPFHKGLALLTIPHMFPIMITPVMYLATGIIIVAGIAKFFLLKFLF